jgi:hypothetical protein
VAVGVLEVSEIVANSVN